jgi:hypothetical protein
MTVNIFVQLLKWVGVENCRYGKAKGKRQEARVKRVWAILRFFTQFGFIVFTYLITPGLSIFWAFILRKGIN